MCDKYISFGISTVEIPRGCSVTFYNKQNGDDSDVWAKVNVPVDTPSPYIYYAMDFRFDSDQLESNCKGSAINDCITSLGVIQDSNSYVMCDSDQKTYIYENAVGQGGDEMILSGIVTSDFITEVTHTGDTVGNDELSTFAVSEGCELIFYDGFVSDNDPIYVPWPKIRDITSEVLILKYYVS